MVNKEERIRELESCFADQVEEAEGLAGFYEGDDISDTDFGWIQIDYSLISNYLIDLLKFDKQYRDLKGESSPDFKSAFNLVFPIYVQLSERIGNYQELN